MDESNDASEYSGGAYFGFSMIRIPEMYYIMAECDPDPQSSAEILDMVRFKRGIASSDATDGGKGYDEPDTREGFDSGHTRRINEVMREYLKEYYGEGSCSIFINGTTTSLLQTAVWSMYGQSISSLCLKMKICLV